MWSFSVKDLRKIHKPKKKHEGIRLNPCEQNEPSLVTICRGVRTGTILHCYPHGGRTCSNTSYPIEKYRKHEKREKTPCFHFRFDEIGFVNVVTENGIFGFAECQSTTQGKKKLMHPIFDHFHQD
jgi:hypothetical protein